MLRTHLDQEQPSPAGMSRRESKLQETCRQEASNDVGERHGRPEEAEAQRELMVLVKVGQVKDYLPFVSLTH